MKFEAFSFGSIRIDGLTYEHDVVIDRGKIRDYGCGISADLLPRIFDPYFTTKPGGSGLGLAFEQHLLFLGPKPI